MKKERVRFGIIGLGSRGYTLLEFLLPMDDIDVNAVCDVYEDRVQRGIEEVKKYKGNTPTGYTDYRELLKRDDIDAVFVFTSWTTHSEIALAAMNAGLDVGIEVGGSASINECWDLVKTSQKTGKICMMLENCCYDRNELAILNMVKKGIFGEIIHCQGGYQHDLRDEISLGRENRHYRLNNFLNRNGELYPTHELGPIAKILNINRGNRMISLTSMASKARGLNDWIKKNPGKADDMANTAFTQGDIVTTMIKCAHGETILLIHDTTLPRPYSRALRIQGTNGIWMEDNGSIHIENVSNKHCWQPFNDVREKYEHPLWKEYLGLGVKGGHGGIDYLVQRAFIESIKNGTKPPIDVYDTAAWMCITALSEQSIAMGSAPVAIPDFTEGKWIHREPCTPSKYALDNVYDNLF